MNRNRAVVRVTGYRLGFDRVTAVRALREVIPGLREAIASHDRAASDSGYSLLEEPALTLAAALEKGGAIVELDVY